ncbi:hypothetical protein NH340_JMT00186 [Sarcoptes scabiei]|nr:hypothetical protein NH340_JMT00186 [Sarcoptes scabiei]
MTLNNWSHHQHHPHLHHLSHSHHLVADQMIYSMDLNCSSPSQTSLTSSNSSASSTFPTSSSSSNFPTELLSSSSSSSITPFSSSSVSSSARPTSTDLNHELLNYQAINSSCQQSDDNNDHHHQDHYQPQHQQQLQHQNHHFRSDSISGQSISSSDCQSIQSESIMMSFLERKSYRPFRSNEEYLIAMKEDLAEWLNTLYDLDLNSENFLSRLENGVILCQHANSVLRKVKEWRIQNNKTIKNDFPKSATNSSTTIACTLPKTSRNVETMMMVTSPRRSSSTTTSSTSLIPQQSSLSSINSSSTGISTTSSTTSTASSSSSQSSLWCYMGTNETGNACNGYVDNVFVVDRRDLVPIKLNATPGTFQARDNVANFIEWCRQINIHQCLLFETEDLVARKNEKSFILCLLEVARYGAKFGVLAPTLVQFEQEIDREIENDNQRKRLNGNRFDDDNDRERLLNGHLLIDSRDDVDEGDDDGINDEPQQQITNNDLESLHEKVVNLLSRCTCPVQFFLEHLSEGKYRIGDTRTLIFVRILRNHVMVRVGGGWDTLEHYLEKHDPCRCRFGHHRLHNSSRVSLQSFQSNLNFSQLNHNGHHLNGSNHQSPSLVQNHHSKKPITVQVTVNRSNPQSERSNKTKQVSKSKFTDSSSLSSLMNTNDSSFLSSMSSSSSSSSATLSNDFNSHSLGMLKTPQKICNIERSKNAYQQSSLLLDGNDRENSASNDSFTTDSPTTSPLLNEKMPSLLTKNGLQDPHDLSFHSMSNTFVVPDRNNNIKGLINQNNTNSLSTKTGKRSNEIQPPASSISSASSMVPSSMPRNRKSSSSVGPSMNESRIPRSRIPTPKTATSTIAKMTPSNRIPSSTLTSAHKIKSTSVCSLAISGGNRIPALNHNSSPSRTANQFKSDSLRKTNHQHHHSSQNLIDSNQTPIRLSSSTTSKSPSYYSRTRESKSRQKLNRSTIDLIHTDYCDNRSFDRSPSVCDDDDDHHQYDYDRGNHHQNGVKEQQLAANKSTQSSYILSSSSSGLSSKRKIGSNLPRAKSTTLIASLSTNNQSNTNDGIISNNNCKSKSINQSSGKQPPHPQQPRLSNSTRNPVRLPSQASSSSSSSTSSNRYIHDPTNQSKTRSIERGRHQGSITSLNSIGSTEGTGTASSNGSLNESNVAINTNNNKSIATSEETLKQTKLLSRSEQNKETKFDVYHHHHHQRQQLNDFDLNRMRIKSSSSTSSSPSTALVEIRSWLDQ